MLDRCEQGRQRRGTERIEMLNGADRDRTLGGDEDMLGDADRRQS
jgi:hypothetical protein